MDTFSFKLENIAEQQKDDYVLVAKLTSGTYTLQAFFGTKVMCYNIKIYDFLITESSLLQCGQDVLFVIRKL